MKEHLSAVLFARYVFCILCSADSENQRRPGTSLSPGSKRRRQRYAPGRLDVNETVLGRGAFPETVVRRDRQGSQDHQQRKVSIP